MLSLRGLLGQHADFFGEPDLLGKAGSRFKFSTTLNLVAGLAANGPPSKAHNKGRTLKCRNRKEAVAI
ncbi:hypothetical protein BH20ACI3_BH20ACI3_36320 [soil metagenome]